MAKKKQTVKEDQDKYPLNPLCKRWMEKIRLAKEFKKVMFQNDADEAMKFFTCGKELHEAMWQRNKTENRVPHDDEEDMPAPRFRIVVGKVAELVELFGPTLYHRNPDIVVESKTLEIPNEMLFPLIPQETVQQAQMAAQQAGQQFDMNSLIPPDPDENKNKLISKLLAYYLNYIQRENNKKTESRRAIDEALIKGMGLLWTEVFETFPGGPSLVGSFYDTVDNLLIDPDAETMDEAWWIARRRVQPYWEVADKFNLDEDYLKERYAQHESLNAQAESVGSKTADDKRKVGKTNDLIEYWEIYSKMGFGQRLKDTPDVDDDDPEERAMYETLRKFGDNVFIAVADRVPYPLNFHTNHLHELTGEKDEEVLDQMHEEKLEDVSWPIPFWADSTWPFTAIQFHEVPNNPWPMSHIKPGLGYLKFLNWVMSFLINKIRVSARSVAATMKATGEEIVQRLFSGKDFEVLELEGNLGADSDINKLVSFLKMPDVQTDVWKIIESVMDLFDKATGLTEIMYGAPGGMRSAEEARVKQGNASVRSDDMANKVEDALSDVARKEAMAARWLLEEKSLKPVLGQRGVSLWMQFVATTEIQTVAREFNYRVEAGSAKKPNKDSQAQIVTQMIQVIPPLLQLASNPQFLPLINLLIDKAAEANDWDLKDHIIPQPIPQPNPEQQKVEAEIEMNKQELQMKQQGQQADLQFQREKNNMQMQATQAKTQADVQKSQMEMQIEHQKVQQEMAINKAKMQQDVTLSRMDMLSRIAMKKQDMAVHQQESQQGMAMEREKTQQGMALEHQRASNDTAMQQREHQAGLQQQAQEHQANIKQTKETHSQELQHREKAAVQERQAIKAKAKAKPKPKGDKK